MASWDDLTFGVEIEVAGIDRPTAIQAVAQGLGALRPADWAAEVVDPRGRVWKAVNDCSISPWGCEVVTPILKGAEDIERLQAVIRSLRSAGASVNESCGIHVHVGSVNLKPDAIARLAKTVYRYEQMIEAMVQPLPERRACYCQPVQDDFVNRLRRMGNAVAEDQINRAWYGSARGNRSVEQCPSRYDSSRYSGLNLNSHFFRGTIEFRWFNGTLHAGKVRAYVTLCLALVAAARDAKKASGLRFEFNPDNPKYATHLLLRRLGIDDKAVRQHLEGHVPGIAAWKDGYPAERRPRGARPALAEAA